MQSPDKPRRSDRWLIGGLTVWVIFSAVLLFAFAGEWQRAVADKVGFLNLPPVVTLFRPALGLIGCAHLVIGIALLMTRRWWLGRNGTPLTVPIAPFEPVKKAGAVWWIVLALLLSAALVERLPRMNLSLWGDESLCLYGYIAGRVKPVKAEEPQGPMRFVKTPWSTTIFSDDGGGNNHFLYSILTRLTLELWREWTQQPKGAFSEPLLRFWPLMFGLASLAALAGLMKRLGLAWAGLLAAALLALHPWHLRFSAEARGYALMLFFFISALWAWVNALERGRWRDWVLVAVCQFFALYSWKGVIYPLLAMNAVAAGAIASSRREGDKWMTLGRWFACNSIAAVVFIPLVAAAQIQMLQMLPRIAKMGNQEANWAWIRNLLADTVMGCQAWLLDVTNPEEVCLDRWMAAHPILVPAALGFFVLFIFGGWLFLARRSAVFAVMLIMIPVGGVLAAVHFKGFLNIELLRWYWFFLTPVMALLASAGAVAWWHGKWPRMLSSAVLLGAVAIVSWPMCVVHTTKATEDLRGALELARGAGYRYWEDMESSKVKTVWLWRHSRIYDPRGTTKGESAAQVQGYMREADAKGLDFYLISGYPALTNLLFPDVLPVLDNPACFEKVRTFWAQLPQNTLVVYHYRAASLTKEPAPVETR